MTDDRLPTRDAPGPLSKRVSKRFTGPPASLDGTDQAGTPEGRCGYVHDVSTVPDLGPMCCLHPVWDDHDRCVWHTEDVAKSYQVLDDDPLAPGERIDGIVLTASMLRHLDWFDGRVLVDAEFRRVHLRGCSFAGADLRNAVFANANLQGADLTAANLEDAYFDDCDLREARFIDARLNEVVFAGCRANRSSEFGQQSVYERELDDTDDESFVATAEAAVWTYNALRQLFEANSQPPISRTYYVKEKNMVRRISWHNGNYLDALTEELSRWVTGYGMRPWRVLGTMFAVIFLFSLLYPFTGGIQESIDEQTLTWRVSDAPGDVPRWYLLSVFARSIYFSTITFTTLGYGDIQPVGLTARALAGVEALSGALLTALLVFVLTRRIT